MGGRWGEESKAIANQTSLGSGVKFGAAQYQFPDVHFRVSSLKIRIRRSKNRLRKKTVKRLQTSSANRFELDLEVARTHFEDSKTSV